MTYKKLTLSLIFHKLELTIILLSYIFALLKKYVFSRVTVLYVQASTTPKYEVFEFCGKKWYLNLLFLVIYNNIIKEIDSTLKMC